MAQAPFPHAKAWLTCAHFDDPTKIECPRVDNDPTNNYVTDYFKDCLCNYSTENEICIQKPSNPTYIVPETCEELGLMLEARYSTQERDKALKLRMLSSEKCEWNEDETQARSKDDSADDSTVEPRFKADDLYCELN